MEMKLKKNVLIFLLVSTGFHRNIISSEVFCVLLTVGFIKFNKKYSVTTTTSILRIETSEYKFYQFNLLPNQSVEQYKVCKLPKLKLIGHENNEKYVDCRMRYEWGYLKNFHWYLNKTVVSLLRDVKCRYRNVSRVDDFKLEYTKFDMLNDGQIIKHDVIEVVCFANNFRLKYDNLHVQIINKLDKLEEHFNSTEEELETKNKTENVKNEQCKPLNILLLSYDSLSRVSWFKRLPKTTEYIINKMNFTILYGQNILGDGTPACMIPLLTGKLESELPSTLKSDPNGQYVDQVYPFIWHDLHKKGYMSFHMEDWPQVSAFTYRLRGMSNKTAHHYMRSYQLSLWSRVSGAYFSKKDDFCIGSIKRHKKALNLIDEFISMYENKSKNHIAIMHYIENSHDGNDRANHSDEDLKYFLKTNFENGRFDNTAIFLYSDHGTRFATERLTSQGDLEERLPFFSIYLPQAYRDSNPIKYKNLVKNSQQLTTALDIYQTIRDLTCLPKSESNNNIRAQSLLDLIPSNRSCESIGISIHYCVCELEWKEINTSENLALKASEYVLDYMNKLFSNVQEYCHRLSLAHIIFVRMAQVKMDNFIKVNLITSPNNGHYETMMKYNASTSQLEISSPDSISRTNPYGNQPRCLQFVPPKKNLTIDLRKFCFCKRRIRI